MRRIGAVVRWVWRVSGVSSVRAYGVGLRCANPTYLVPFALLPEIKHDDAPKKA